MIATLGIHLPHPVRRWQTLTSALNTFETLTYLAVAAVIALKCNACAGEKGSYHRPLSCGNLTKRSPRAAT